MTKITKLVIDCTTGVQEEIELSPEELKQLEKDKAKYEADKAASQAEAAANAQAKAALLDRLGITAEEAKLLLS